MPDETFADRLVALKDIVPPTYRKHLSNTLSTTSSWFQTTLNYGGKTLWVVSTSVLLLGVPWALAFAEEQQMAEMEREMKMQQSANEVSLQHISEEGDLVLTPKPTAPYSATTGQARSVNVSFCFFALLLCSCIKNALFSSPVQLFPWWWRLEQRNAINSTNSSFCSSTSHTSDALHYCSIRASYKVEHNVHV
jgi:hypothetical protein